MYSSIRVQSLIIIYERQLQWLRGQESLPTHLSFHGRRGSSAMRMSPPLGSVSETIARCECRRLRSPFRRCKCRRVGVEFKTVSVVGEINQLPKLSIIILHSLFWQLASSPKKNKRLLGKQSSHPQVCITTLDQLERLVPMPTD